MKKLFASILVVSTVFFGACGSNNQGVSGTSPKPIEITGSFNVGNFTMTVPEGFSAKANSDHSYFLSSNSGGCSMAIFAVDVSPLDEAHVQEYITSQEGVFQDEDCYIYGEKTTPANFAGTLLDMLIYVEIDAQGDATLTTEGTFTDSWYAYTASVQYPVDSDNANEFINAWCEFCSTAKYIGENPRFESVNFGYTESIESDDTQPEATVGTTSPTEMFDPGTKENPYQSGMYKVGVDLPAGEYMFIATGSSRAYVCASSDSNQDDILENENFSGSFFMTVKDGQYLEASRCEFVVASEYIVEINEDGSFEDGMYRVGIDIPAGEYKLTATTDSRGYWCIYNDTSVPFDIVNNDNFENSTYVTVRDGQYLQLSHCIANPT